MNIALIEDKELEIKQLKEIILNFEKQIGISFSIECFSNAEDFINNFEEYKYSVIFADIFMNGMTGLDMAKLIRNKDLRCIIIFITSSNTFMPQAFSCHAFEYIQKPINKDKIYNVLFDIVKFIPNLCKYCEFIYNRKTVKLMFSDIACVMADKHNSNIINTKGDIFSPNTGFSKIIKQLDDQRFLLINRGILVNMDHIISFENNTCYLKGNINLPVKIRERTRIERIWQNYTFNQIHSSLKGDV